MEYLLSALYTIVDVACLLLFLSAFAAPRFVRHKQWLLSGAYFTTIYLILCLNMTLFEYNMSLKVTLVLACGFLFGRILYTNISTPYVFFLVLLEYLLTYLFSFIGLHLSALVCGVSVPEFRYGPPAAFIISSVIYYFLQVLFILSIGKMVSSRKILKGNLKSHPIQAILYVLFPLASFIMLLVLLRATSKQGLPDGFMIACCWMIFIANAAILYLLDQSEKERLNREQLLSLNQQLQLQEKNAKELVGLYSSQRKQIHDFRAHLNMLDQLLCSQQYDAANHYIHSVSAQQTERIFLVNCHHAVLDALFNSKASEAMRKDIDLHFEVNDLSPLSLNEADLTVLLSNLIDNAIEGCERCPSYREIQIRAFIERGCFHFIIRNTSLPVTILNGEIPSTKADPHLHGYGLANIKAILKKYNAEYTMFYHNGYFQFVFELLLSA